MLKLAITIVLAGVLLTFMLAFYDWYPLSPNEQAIMDDINRDHAGDISRYTEAIKADPSDVNNYKKRAYSYKMIMQYRTALPDLTKVIELLPNDPESYRDRGYTYLQVGQYDKAIDDFSKGLDLAPDLVILYMFRADAYEYLGKDDLAKADRQKVQELDQKKKQQFFSPAVAPAN